MFNNVTGFYRVRPAAASLRGWLFNLPLQKTTKGNFNRIFISGVPVR
jgi:hypothetical protein